jgi:pimeloyl-ACP methyl ester carboxylesterase
MKEGIVLAVYPDFRAAVLVAGGLPPFNLLDEVSITNYLPRVFQPVLMINGRHDLCSFPVETNQEPFFNFLGTSPENKKHLIFENRGHIPARSDLINETIAWYDKYLGKVELKN